MNGIKRITALGVVLAVLFSASGPSAADEPRNVDLASLIQAVLARNPGVKAKKAEYEALRSRAIRSWLPEDPTFGVDVEGQPDLFRFNQRMDNEYMAEQKIPFPTKLFLGAVIASREADMAYQRYKEEERNAIWHVEEPYYELFVSQKTLSLLKETQTLLEQLVKSARARYESNQASQTDLLKAQIESAKNAVEVFDMGEKVHLQKAHFAHLLDEPLDTPYEIQVLTEKRQFDYGLPELERIALDKRPELKSLELALERARSSRLLTKTEWFPDVTFRYEGRQFKGENNIRENDTFIGVTVPFWSLVKGIGGVWRGADQEVTAAENAYFKMKNEVLLSVHEAYSKIRSAENALNAYQQQVLPQAKQQVEIGFSAYEAGKESFLELIDAERTLRSAQIEYYRLWANYRIGIADLRLAVGDGLERAV